MSQLPVKSISPKDLNELLGRDPEIELIDVRPREMFDNCRVEQADFIDFETLDPKALMKARRLQEDEPLYIICQKGIRSVKTCELFIEAGITNVVNIEGGTGAWAEAGLPVIGEGKAAGSVVGEIIHKISEAIHPDRTSS